MSFLPAYSFFLFLLSFYFFFLLALSCLLACFLSFIPSFSFFLFRFLSSQILIQFIFQRVSGEIMQLRAKYRLMDSTSVLAGPLSP